MLALIVPYRNRADHLERFVPHTLSFLCGVDVCLIVIEQADGKPFNRGKLLNIGFDLVGCTADWVCFHDVDMLPLDSECDYSRPSQTTHLAGCVEQFAFQMPYTTYLGGVLLTLPEEYERVNGCSNEYWGWGAEDDDLYLRFLAAGIKIARKPGRYSSLWHERAEQPRVNVERYGRFLRRAVTAEVCDPMGRPEHEGRAVVASLVTEVCAEGLSTLDYRIVSRAPLSTRVQHPETACHEIISVLV